MSESMTDISQGLKLLPTIIGWIVIGLFVTGFIVTVIWSVFLAERARETISKENRKKFKLWMK